MLAGYHSYFNEMTDDLLNSFEPSWLSEMAARLFRAAWSCSRRRSAESLATKRRSRLKRLLKKGLRIDFRRSSPRQPVYPREFAKFPSLRKFLWWNTTREGLVELLRYADRNSMAHSREVRLPFLDHHLVEFVFKATGAPAVERWLDEVDHTGSVSWTLSRRRSVIALIN